MRLRSMLVVLMLAILPVAFAANGSEPPVTPGAAPAAATVVAPAEEQVPAEEQEPNGAQLQFAPPPPGPATAPPDAGTPAEPEPPSCIPPRRSELRRGLVRLLAEIAHTVVR